MNSEMSSYSVSFTTSTTTSTTSTTSTIKNLNGGSIHPIIPTLPNLIINSITTLPSMSPTGTKENISFNSLFIKTINPINPINHSSNIFTKEEEEEKIYENLINENRELERNINHMQYLWRQNQKMIYKIHLDKIIPKEDNTIENIKTNFLKELQKIKYKNNWRYIPSIHSQISYLTFEKILSEGDLTQDDALYINYINTLVQKIYPEKFIKVEDVIVDDRCFLKIKIFLNN